MTRRVTERGLVWLGMPECARRGFRLLARSKTATGARADMLRAMSEAYIAFGLALSHHEHNSPPEKVADLVQAGYESLNAARAAVAGR